MRRVIQDMVEDPLSDKLLAGEFHPGDTVVVDREGDGLVMRALTLAEVGEKG
ncbi:MAG: hypothetical protein ACE5IA_09005 [Dehalococcoidia bacterium]